MKKRSVFALSCITLAAFACIVVFASQYFDNGDNQPIANEEAEEFVIMSVSWEYNHADIEELSNESDVIALVRVEGISSEYMLYNVPFTDFYVRVLTPIYGVTEGDILTVVMTGGLVDGVLTEITDDPLMEKGNEFLIFARTNEDGTHTILSGPQGRYVYENGVLNTLTPNNSRAIEHNEFSSIQVVDVDFDYMVDKIKTALQ